MMDAEIIRKAREFCDDLRGLRQVEPDTGVLSPATTAFLDTAQFRPHDRQDPTSAVGQLWSVRTPPGQGPTAVLLTRVTDGLPRGVLATRHAWLASGDDVVVPGDMTPTGDAWLLCLWTDTPIAASMLDGWIGNLAVPVVTAVRMLLQNALTGGFTHATLGTVSRRNVVGAYDAARELVRRSITAPGGRTIEFLSGLPIVDEDDPRAEARAVFRTATTYVYETALAELEARDDQVPAEPRKLSLADAIRARIVEMFDDLGTPWSLEPAHAFAGVHRGNADDNAPRVATTVVLGGVAIEIRVTLSAVVSVDLTAIEARPVEVTLEAIDDKGTTLISEKRYSVDGVIPAFAIDAAEGVMYRLRIASEGATVIYRW